MSRRYAVIEELSVLHCIVLSSNILLLSIINDISQNNLRETREKEKEIRLKNDRFAQLLSQNTS